MKPRPDYSVYLVTDETLAGVRGVEAAVRAAVEGGVTLVQVRAKRAAARDVLARARALREWLTPRNVPLIVNDRLDLALAVGAAGVHLGQDDLPCADARRLAGPDFLIGVSVSAADEARRAAADGADYLAVSPVFATPTKPDAPHAVGLEGLRAIRAAVNLPLVGIGGLHAGNAEAVIRAGAQGVAVVSAILAAPDPRTATRDLVRAVLAGRDLRRQFADGG